MGKLARDLGLYTLARFGMVAVLAVVIIFGAKIFGVAVPVLIALIFAVVLSLPLSMLFFKRLRIRVNEDIAAVDERRRRDKADLRAKLRGEDVAE
ncbi:DUF4229 domain-containing protein [Antrihabitans cavernicola]|uniref:DUF4229 domain-containing protein n=2 Tax=Antrihabitans cavernicola TaxID=2495913 RepID=A0A5A7S8L7_9NOCA|nr:DUF4229 domain-containing protein [Spelaeibacter cavernicola]KAA0020224.1 DUF4229 domain-containing protein [Spelaeibacter cavernicola]